MTASLYIRFFCGSGKASLGGIRLSIIMCRGKANVLRNMESVPCNRSRTPSTPKQLLNLFFKKTKNTTVNLRH